MKHHFTTRFQRHPGFWSMLVLLGGLALAFGMSKSGLAGPRIEEHIKPPAAEPQVTQSDLTGVVLAAYASGLNQPTDIAHSGLTDDTRLFIAEKEGTIRVIDGGGNVLPADFLNIDGRVQSGVPGEYGAESGLLGLVFDPDYEANGYFYVNYTYAGDGDIDNTGEGENHISPVPGLGRGPKHRRPRQRGDPADRAPAPPQPQRRGYGLRAGRLPVYRDWRWGGGWGH